MFRQCCKLTGIQLTAIALVMLLPIVGHADVTEVDNAALARLVDDGATIIDVRRQDEWESSGILPDSHPLTFFDAQGRYDVDKWLSDLSAIADKDEQIVLICAHGVRSSRIADLLDSRLGYSAVHNVSDGIEGWRESGRKTSPFVARP